MMYLCERTGHSAWRYPFSYGRGGIDKHSAGDEKTPVGVYSLGVSRASADFHIFIPVGYPTKEQKKTGYTGGAIGVHGPYRTGIFEIIEYFLGASLIINWTSGCLAVSSRHEIEEIADFVSSRKVNTIRILE